MTTKTWVITATIKLKQRIGTEDRPRAAIKVCCNKWLGLCDGHGHALGLGEGHGWMHWGLYKLGFVEQRVAEFWNIGSIDAIWVNGGVLAFTGQKAMSFNKRGSELGTR